MRTRLCDMALRGSAPSVCLALLCFAAAAQAQKVVKGPDMKIFNGTGNTYYILDAAGVPISAGLNLSATAVESIPSSMSDGKRCVTVVNGTAADAEVAACEAANATMCFGHKYRGMDYTIRPGNPGFESPCVGGHAFFMDMPNGTTESKIPFSHLQVGMMLEVAGNDDRTHAPSIRE